MEGDSQTEAVRATPPTKIRFDLAAFVVNRFSPKSYRPISNGIGFEWKHILRLDPDSTVRIFLAEGGYLVGLAYLSAKRDVELGLILEPDDSRLLVMSRFLDDFEKSSVANRRSLAAKTTELFRSLVGPTSIPSAPSQQPESGLANGTDGQTAATSDSSAERTTDGASLEHQNKRRRTDEDNGRPAVFFPRTSCPPVSVVNSPEPITTIAIDIATQLQTAAPTPVTRIIGPTTNPVDNTISLNTAIHHISIDDAKRLLPADLVESIVTRPDPKNEDNLLAAISLSFPATDNLPHTCQMAFEIAPENISHYAFALFRVRLKTKHGFQQAYIGDGLKMLPTPKLTLQGAWRDMIPVVFGPEISSAICASPIYVADARRRLDTTDSVSLEIDGQPDVSAIMYAYVEPQKGLELKNRLSAPSIER
ncbi:hypothetical protein BKA56DRAFT_594088 [Ilyonectria sp. MPI-CAGE-AT-0026]|nr:hypothetical protein BKA56DRAFT_594088 [Ilyonectria sp. MPI-CAGE-AT-0026]